jgi:hypothetical protein
VNVNRLAPVLWLGMLALAACDGQVRFDDRPEVDAGAGADLPATLDLGVISPPDASGVDGSDGPFCDTGNCRFGSDDCPGPECHLYCPAAGRCTDSCGAGCAADCEQLSTCGLGTGINGQVKCEQDATCGFDVGSGTTIECSPRANCQTRCSGSCVLDCFPTATCLLGCAGATPRPVTGRTTCP